MTLDIILILVCAALFEWQITKIMQEYRAGFAHLGLSRKDLKRLARGEQ